MPHKRPHGDEDGLPVQDCTANHLVLVIKTLVVDKWAPLCQACPYMSCLVQVATLSQDSPSLMGLSSR